MKNVLVICRTYFQVLMAITLKYTEFNQDKVDIIITDQLANVRELKAKLNKNKLFGNVIYIPIKNIYKESKHIQRITKLIYMELLPEKQVFIDKLKDIKYDHMLLNNVDVLAEAIFLKYYKKNNNIKVSLYEEGYGTYTNIYAKHLEGKKIKNNARKLLKKFNRRKYILDIADDLYVLDPDLMCWKPNIEVKSIKLPKLGYEGYIKDMNEIFSYEEIKDEYKEEIIFLEESYFADGKVVKDKELIQKIYNRFSKHSILIKLHPRNLVNRFKELGYRTNDKTGVPWEVIVLNMKENDNKVFMTIGSSSVLSYRLLGEKSFKTIMLFRCIEKSDDLNIDNSVIEYIDRFQKKYGQNLFIPNSIEEIDMIIN